MGQNKKRGSSRRRDSRGPSQKKKRGSSSRSSSNNDNRRSSSNKSRRSDSEKPRSKATRRSDRSYINRNIMESGAFSSGTTGMFPSQWLVIHRVVYIDEHNRHQFSREAFLLHAKVYLDERGRDYNFCIGIQELIPTGDGIFNADTTDGLVRFMYVPEGTHSIYKSDSTSPRYFALVATRAPDNTLQMPLSNNGKLPSCAEILHRYRQVWHVTRPAIGIKRENSPFTSLHKCDFNAAQIVKDGAMAKDLESYLLFATRCVFSQPGPQTHTALMNANGTSVLTSVTEWLATRVGMQSMRLTMDQTTAVSSKFGGGSSNGQSWSAGPNGQPTNTAVSI